MIQRRMIVLLLLPTALTVLAQTAPTSITGRVTTDDGQPATRISVSASSTGTNPVRRSAITDDDGRFQLSDLPEAAYRVFAGAQGYVSDAVPGESQFHLPGESVSLILRKGGVITGKALTPGGEPAIEASMAVTRVRDGEGHPVAEGGSSTMTDDRGIYRAYGLPPGVYVVSVSGGQVFGPSQSPFSSNVRTYYPSSSRATAAEITVRGGEEIGGIDIRWRGEQGRTISGRVIAGPAEAGSTWVRLVDHATHDFRGWATTQLENGQSVFELRGVADGDYDLFATSGYLGVDKAMFSLPRRLTVKGTDVPSLELALLPSASVSGKVRIDPEAGSACEEKGRVSIQAVTFQLPRMRGSNGPERSDPPGSWLESPVDNRGEFAMLGIQPGRYQLIGLLPGSSLFVRSLAIQINNGPAGQAKDTITLASGDRLSVNVTVSPGAASLAGNIADAGGRRLRIHLVPKERERSDQPVYYYESLGRSDNSFSIEQIAPGSYWVTVREVKLDEPLEGPRVAWDARDRAKLRVEAEAAKQEITLQSCQRVTSFTLRYALRNK